MPASKRLFACGHRGLGKFCHACRESKAKRAREAEEEAAREALAAAWGDLFPRQRGDYRRFPPQVVSRAIELGRRLLTGAHFANLGGDRMRHDAGMIRVELPGYHRLVFREESDGGVSGLRVLTHADYNQFFAGDRGG